MKPSLLKSLITVLIPTLILTFSTNVLGLEWCVGENGHTKIEYPGSSNCCDEGTPAQSGVKKSPVSEYAFGNVGCAPCLDFVALNDTALSKRFKSWSSFKEIASADPKPYPAFHNNKYHSNKLKNNQPPRISQTILSHRKVVLLN